MASRRRDEEARVEHDGAHEEDETGHLLRNSLTTSPLAADMPLPSDETLMEPSDSIELHHLTLLSDPLKLNYHYSEGPNLAEPDTGTPSRNHRELLPPLPMPVPESYPHDTLLLHLPASSSDSSSNISDGGSGASSSGAAGSSTNGRPVKRPRGPRASVSLSPSEWGSRNRRTSGFGSPTSA